jgi:uncharacterized protein (TIGR02596 family)
MNTRSLCRAPGFAFTLIEMLIVVSVIGLLLALSAPRVFSLLRSNELSTQGDSLRNWLSMAQQQAISTNAPVEVRFYKYADQDESQTQPEFRCAQYYQFDRNGDLKPTSQIFMIKSPVSLSKDPKLSNILDKGKNNSYGILASGEDAYKALFGSRLVTGAVEYSCFRFRPDGSTDLDPRPSSDPDNPAYTWYLTLVQEGQTSKGTGSIGASAGVPRNFFCLQIDQFNGTIREFRP